MTEFVWVSNDISYIYSVSFYSPTTLYYTYVEPSGLSVSNYIVYSYTGSESVGNNKISDWRSDFTQSIANNFQYWNSIRKNIDSCGQIFINSIATNIEIAYKYLQKERKELWIETSDINQPNKLWMSELPDEIDFNKSLNRNFLVNSQFNRHPLSRYEIPEYWTDGFSLSSGRVYIDTNDSLLGCNCVRIDSNSGSYNYLGQVNRSLIIPKGTNLTASVYYKSPINSEYIGYSPARLELKLLNNSNNNLTTGITLKPGTSNKWYRSYVSILTTEDYTHPEFSIDINNTGNINHSYKFAAPVLEFSDQANPYEKNHFDTTNDLKLCNQLINIPVNIYSSASKVTDIYTGITNYYSTGFNQANTLCHYIKDKDLFLSNNLNPTRIEITTGITSGVSITNSLYGFITSYYDSPQEKGWTKTASGVSTYRWPDLIDIVNNYGIAEPNLDKSNIDLIQPDLNSNSIYFKYNIPLTNSFQTGNGYGLTVEAFTIKDDKIWCIAKESYTGSTYRVLKIIDPRTEYNKNYLELIKDFKLLPIGTGGTVTSIGFDSSQSNRLIVSITGESVSSGNYIDLKYDYFTINFNNRTAFLREVYNNQSIIIY